MDFNNYNPYDNSDNHQPNFSSNPNYYAKQPVVNPYEKASFLLGIVSIFTCSIIYVSFPAGAIAIIFAILSKGGNIKFGSKARLGVLLGVIGLILTIIFYAVAFSIALAEYGSIEAILREACEMAGYDFEMLYGDFFK